MRAPRVVAVLGLVAASTVFAAPAQAGTETCGGVPATIIASPDASSSNRVIGTGGRDVIVLMRTSSVSVYTGAGDDLVCLRGEASDELFVNVFAGSGDDTILNESTQQAPSPYDYFTVIAQLGDGEDTYVGGPENELVKGADDLSPDTEADVVSTRDGFDHVESGLTRIPNRDRIDTGGGRDRVLLAGSGTPELSVVGGPQRDYIQFRSQLPEDLYFRFPPGDVVVDNRAGTLVIGVSEWVRWSDFESLGLEELDRRSVTVIGGDGVERVFLARRSTYRVDLNGGDDYVVFGGSVLPEGSYDGGPGRDLLGLAVSRGADVDLRGRVGTWSLARRSVSRATNFEDASISARIVRVRGNAGGNRVSAFGFLEVVVDGLGGDDVVRIKTPQAERMIARGNAGDDLLIGSRTADVLVGGAGQDEAQGRNDIDQCLTEVRVECES